MGKSSSNMGQVYQKSEYLSQHVSIHSREEDDIENLTKTTKKSKRGVNKKVLKVLLIEHKTLSKFQYIDHTERGIRGIMEGRSPKVLCLLPTGTKKHCFQQRP
ncbi:unnamed protein product [Lactuca virosa]|uniref:Uncharacterized protein n=1 Tax=Lactuca virosa TaxID=75947 RepID=A0AAU9LQN4_9ASTR|nr:unnamed protein product [Lactuca virosa]